MSTSGGLGFTNNGKKRVSQHVSPPEHCGLSPEDVKAMSKHGVLAGRHGMLVTKIAHLICSPQGNGTMTIETARANLVFFVFFSQ